VAAPLVDTSASVIEKLLDFYESNGGTLPASSLAQEKASDPASAATVAGIGFETYENRSNPHVTIHKVGCSQLRKRGGVHQHGQGNYKAHATLSEADRYARSTGLPVKFCGYCAPNGVVEK